MNGEPEKSPQKRQVNVEIGILSREMRMRLEAQLGVSSAGCME